MREREQEKKSERERDSSWEQQGWEMEKGLIPV